MFLFLFHSFKRPRQVWALILEKAMAKFVGSYAHLSGGTEPFAFMALTGFPLVHLGPTSPGWGLAWVGGTSAELDAWDSGTSGQHVPTGWNWGVGDIPIRSKVGDLPSTCSSVYRGLLQKLEVSAVVLQPAQSCGSFTCRNRDQVVNPNNIKQL